MRNRFLSIAVLALMLMALLNCVTCDEAAAAAGKSEDGEAKPRHLLGFGAFFAPSSPYQYGYGNGYGYGGYPFNHHYAGGYRPFGYGGYGGYPYPYPFGYTGYPNYYR